MNAAKTTATLKKWGWNIFCGMCMGAADIVPGISGGTIAFVMGFYERLLSSIKSFNIQSLMLLSAGNWRAFSSVAAWDFIVALGVGILLSIASLSSLFDYLLNHEIYRTYLYSGFMGLILASAVLFGSQMHRWGLSQVLLFCFGAVMAYTFTRSPSDVTATHSFVMASQFDTGIWLNPWVIFCGMAAVCALLLPGVSGSYVLTILGMYPIVIGAVADFTDGLRYLSFKLPSFLFLANLGLGVFLGAMLFSRTITWLLKHYHDITTALLIGFMIGSIKTLWPFWTYQYFENPYYPTMRPRLLLIDPQFPDVHSLTLWMGLMCMVGAFLFVLSIERIAKSKKQEISP